MCSIIGNSKCTVAPHADAAQLLECDMGDGASGHEVEYHAHDASEQGTHAGTDEIETDVDDEGDQTDDEGQAQVGRRVPCHGVPGASENGTNGKLRRRRAGNSIHTFLL